MFQRKQRNPQGEETQDYEINEEVMPMLDYYLSCSLSAVLSDAREHIEFYEVRIALYKKWTAASAGTETQTGGRVLRRNLMPTCKTVQLFPHIAGRKKCNSSSKTIK